MKWNRKKFDQVKYMLENGKYAKHCTIYFKNFNNDLNNNFPIRHIESCNFFWNPFICLCTSQFFFKAHNIYVYIHLHFHLPKQHSKTKRQHFADKSPYSQSYMAFPVVMYGCESWITKKAEY